MSDWLWGDVFLQRCSKTTCDGAHIHIKIGEEGKRPLGDYVTDAAGARHLAALLCQLAAEIEAEGLAAKPS
jgi:hypothetical protein